MGAETRIKDLLFKQRRLREENEDLRRQASYMQTVAEKMIPLVSKSIVAAILEAAKGATTNVRAR